MYDAFGIELLYRHDLNQVTTHAAITTSAPAGPRRYNPPVRHTIAPALAAAFSDLERHPGACQILRDHE